MCLITFKKVIYSKIMSPKSKFWVGFGLVKKTPKMKKKFWSVLAREKHRAYIFVFFNDEKSLNQHRLG